MNPSVSTLSPADRVIRSVDLPASAVGTVANGIEDLYTGTLDVIVVRQALDPATMDAAGDRLDHSDGVGWERPNQASPVEDIGMLGTPATPTYKPPTGPALDAYLKDAAWHRAASERIFGPGFDALGEIERTLAKFSGGRPVHLPVSADGRQYEPFTIRRLVDGTQIGLHHDYHYPLPLYKEITPQCDTTTLISWVVTVRGPEGGGELVVYPIPTDEPNPPKMPNGWSWDVDAVEKRYPSARFPTNEGDIFLFASGRCLHRVNRIAGPRARITMGGFLALAKNHERVLFWS